MTRYIEGPPEDDGGGGFDPDIFCTSVTCSGTISSAQLQTGSVTTSGNLSTKAITADSLTTSGNLSTKAITADSLTTTGQIRSNASTIASSKTTGCIVAVGGIGVGGSVFCQGVRTLGNVIADATVEGNQVISLTSITGLSLEVTNAVTSSTVSTLSTISSGSSITATGALISLGTTDGTSGGGAIIASNGGVYSSKSIYAVQNIVANGNVVGTNVNTSVLNATTANATTVNAATSRTTGTTRGLVIQADTDVLCNRLIVNSKTAIESAGLEMFINGPSNFQAVYINNLALTSLNGINFAYQNGTFNPTLSFINPADASAFSAQININYITRIGRWTRVGNQLTVSVDLAWTNSNTGLQVIGIALERGFPFTVGKGTSAVYNLNSNMEPVTAGGTGDATPMSYYNSSTDKFEQLCWVDDPLFPGSLKPYLYVNGNGPLLGNYNFSYTMSLLIQ